MKKYSTSSQQRRGTAQRRSALNTLDHSKPEPSFKKNNDPNRAKKSSASEFDWANFKQAQRERDNVQHVQHVQHERKRNMNRRHNLFQNTPDAAIGDDNTSTTASLECADSSSPLTAASKVIVIVNMPELEVMMEKLDTVYVKQETTDSICGTSAIDEEKKQKGLKAP